MKLPTAPRAYDQTNEAVARQAILQADAENFKSRRDVLLANGERLGLKASDGSLWSLLVGTDGGLSTSLISPTGHSAGSVRAVPGVYVVSASGDTSGATDTAAITAAFASGAFVVSLAPATYYLNAGITFSNAILQSWTLPGNPATGAVLVFANTVAKCVTLGGASGSNRCAALRGVTVTRAGAPPAGSVGVQVQDVYNAVLEDVNVVGHAIGFNFRTDTTSGISATATRLCSGYITDAHVQLDGWPEFRCTQSRFGTNGVLDVSCNAYVRFTGGSVTYTGQGPNGAFFTQCQFDQGNGVTVLHWLEFVGLVQPLSQAVEFKFDQCHIETSTFGIYSDAATTAISRLAMSDCEIGVGGGTNFFALNAATQIQNWKINGCDIFYATCTYAPALAPNNLAINGCNFGGTVSFNCPVNSAVSFMGNTFASTVTMAGGQYGALSLVGNTYDAGYGALVITATGNVLLAEPQTALLAGGRGQSLAALTTFNPNPTAGMRSYVVDSTTATYGATITGGGANIVPAFYTGAHWVVG